MFDYKIKVCNFYGLVCIPQADFSLYSGCGTKNVFWLLGGFIFSLTARVHMEVLPYVCPPVFYIRISLPSLRVYYVSSFNLFLYVMLLAVANMSDQT